MSGGAAHGLRALRQRAGLSMGGLAAAAGFRGASSLQRYENPGLYGAAWLPLKLARRLEPALVGRGVPPIASAEVLALAGIGPGVGLSAAQRAPLPEPAPPPRAAAEPAPVVLAVAELPRDLPVLGNAEGGMEGAFLLNGQTIDLVRRPPGLAGARDAYALYVVGDSMWPRFEPGALVFVHPGRPVRPGDDVVLQLRPATPGEAGPASVKRLVRRGAERIECVQFNPHKTLVYDADRVAAMHRVLTTAELLGL